MNKLQYIWLLLLTLGSSFAIAQTDEVQETLAKRGEVFFSFAESDIQNKARIARMLSIDEVKDGRVYAYANTAEWQNFLALNIPFQKEMAPGEMGLLHPELFKGSDKSSWNYYPSYQQYDSIMQAFASNYPQICKLHSIGLLASGREILALQISDNVSVDEQEPQFLYTSTMHGDELVGWVLLMRLADHLLQNYGTDSLATRLINGTELWICPNTNPDGTYKAGNNNVFGATRGNANNIDLNRNFPDPEDGPHPDGNTYQQETFLMMGFADTMNFTMGSNLHSGYEVVNYPWDTWAQLPADANWWVYVSHMYADSVHAVSPSGYLMGQGNGVTNGYAWYSVAGGRQDYMNYFHQCREMILELSNDKILAENQLNNHWNYNKTSLLRYIEQTLFGLKGVVTDSLTGDPLTAKIEIIGHDVDSSHVYAHASHGDYYRLLDNGTYDVTYSCPGYFSKTIIGLNIFKTSILIQDVQLVKDTTNAIHHLATEDLEVKLFPNPSSYYVQLEWINKHPEAFTQVELFAIDGKRVISMEVKDIENLRVDISMLATGSYLIRLRQGKHYWKGNLQKQ